MMNTVIKKLFASRRVAPEPMRTTTIDDLPDDLLKTIFVAASPVVSGMVCRRWSSCVLSMDLKFAGYCHDDTERENERELIGHLVSSGSLGRLRTIVKHRLAGHGALTCCEDQEDLYNAVYNAMCSPLCTLDTIKFLLKCSERLGGVIQRKLRMLRLPQRGVEEWDQRLMDLAVRRGRLDVMQWLNVERNMRVDMRCIASSDRRYSVAHWVEGDACGRLRIREAGDVYCFIHNWGIHDWGIHDREGGYWHAVSLLRALKYGGMSPRSWERLCNDVLCHGVRLPTGPMEIASEYYMDDRRSRVASRLRESFLDMMM